MITLWPTVNMQEATAVLFLNIGVITYTILPHKCCYRKRRSQDWGTTTLDKDTQQSLGFHSLSVNCGGPEESHVQINNNFVLQ